MALEAKTLVHMLNDTTALQALAAQLCVQMQTQLSGGEGWDGGKDNADIGLQLRKQLGWAGHRTPFSLRHPPAVCRHNNCGADDAPPAERGATQTSMPREEETKSDSAGFSLRRTIFALAQADPRQR